MREERMEVNEVIYMRFAENCDMLHPFHLSVSCFVVGLRLQHVLAVARLR